MQEKLNLVLLLDDNPATNFIHRKFINQADCTHQVQDFQSGKQVLAYLESEANVLPELLFVDINMPVMDAWEFLEGLKGLGRKGLEDIVIILLSTSMSPSDKDKAEKIEFINDIRLKPLSVNTIHEVIGQFFPDLM